jgi:Fe-S-cluster containining protein
MNDEMIPLSLDDTLRFACSRSVPCFNECCRDLNQFLTPYDILRLKNALEMTSGEFLSTYTLQHTGPESGLPVVTLKPADPKERTCTFVTKEGCRVYENRPSSCRIYPLARLASRSRETGKITEHWALIREPHCRGFEQDETWVVREWINRQGLLEYNEMNDLLMEIISLKNQCDPGPLDIKSRHMFHMACYDIDNFRGHIFEKGLLNYPEMNIENPESLKDDTSLLKFGMEWIKKSLFKR